ncbi:peptidase, partial [Escherichia coli]|nr:peptidase [Escherichia coli]MCX1279424.1 peptidase [Escherichia coli]
MSAIHIFKAGTHTDMHGKKLPFTPDDLAACVKAYDPSVHEAPLVIGHPRTEDPAWGWVKALSLSGVDLMAEPAQLDPQFAEMVTNGRFKKVSASFYLPDSPSNPKPGVLYLRHVGFLGAQPPSVKGLKQVSFSEQEEGVVEFADWQAITNASLWGKLRDFLIARFSLDEAEKVLPEWQLNSLREEAYRDTLSQDAAGAQFSETGPGPSSASNEESSMTKEEIEALQEENRRLKQQAADRDARDAQ